VFSQFLATYPNAVFDVEALTNFTLQGLFHLELSGFGNGPTPVTGELALTASEVLTSQLAEDDELVFVHQNDTTVRAELWKGTGLNNVRDYSAINQYDVFPLADSMIELARTVIADKKNA
jgi:hypothetical protein